jgi:hypothetical protein
MSLMGNCRTMDCVSRISSLRPSLGSLEEFFRSIPGRLPAPRPGTLPAFGTAKVPWFFPKDDAIEKPRCCVRGEFSVALSMPIPLAPGSSARRPFSKRDFDAAPENIAKPCPLRFPRRSAVAWAPPCNRIRQGGCRRGNGRSVADRSDSLADGGSQGREDRRPLRDHPCHLANAGRVAFL